MVEIRVAVGDIARAQGLRRRLTGYFGQKSVLFNGRENEVRVRAEMESRSVLQVIDTVQSWLAAGGGDSATLSVGDRSYTMVGPTGVATRTGRAA